MTWLLLHTPLLLWDLACDASSSRPIYLGLPLFVFILYWTFLISNYLKHFAKLSYVICGRSSHWGLSDISLLIRLGWQCWGEVTGASIIYIWPFAVSVTSCWWHLLCRLTRACQESLYYPLLSLPFHTVSRKTLGLAFFWGERRYVASSLCWLNQSSSTDTVLIWNLDLHYT